MANENETLEARKARLRALREARDAALPKPPTPAEIAAARQSRTRHKSALRGRRLQAQLIANCYAVDQQTGDAVVRIFEAYPHKL